MGDIDFDELDRAVNSLISNTPASPVAPVADTTFVDPAADTTITTPAADNPVQPISPITEPTQPVIEKPVLVPVSQSLAGQRSSGRFMDVIHPSSDMRPSVSIPSQPEQPAVTPIINSDPAIAPQIIPLPTSVQNFSPNSPKPLESPFIAGAVVEKRPLGTFATEPEQPVELSPSGEVTDKSENNEQSAESLAELPDELKSDILKVESGDAKQTTEPEPEKEPEPEPEKEQEPAQPIAQPEPVVPTSIVQQYKEQPSATTEKTGSIYDTSVYNKSPKPIDKKSSGWMWILWIIILLIIGIGTGALTYFYILPLL